jgi:hypothetical protein
MPALSYEVSLFRGERSGRDVVVRWCGPSWFRGAQARHEAHIEAGGVDKDVLLLAADVNHEIDAAYRSKYRRYAESIVSPKARAGTLKLVPR